jgi:hypothetical protein
MTPGIVMVPVSCLSVSKVLAVQGRGTLFRRTLFV